MEQHLLEAVSDGVATLTLNRPERLNALSTPIMDGLLEALPRLARDSAVGAIVLTGAGRAFCAGGDMTGVPRIASPFDNKAFVDELDAVHARIRGVRKPIVAAVHGLVLGSGLGLTALFDFVIAAEGTRFGLIEGRVGHPGATDELDDLRRRALLLRHRSPVPFAPRSVRPVTSYFFRVGNAAESSSRSGFPSPGSTTATLAADFESPADWPSRCFFGT